jgi:hypothetical protein
MAQSITRLSGVNSLSGIIPAGNIANSTLDNITTLPAAVPTGKLKLLSTATASASSSIEFTSGIDSTYDVYQFEFINIHPATNDVAFTFQGSTDGGSNYGVNITSTAFRARHSENDVETGLDYQTSWDLAQSTSFQLMGQSGNDNDQNIVSTLQIFNPSSTTYVKHWIITTNYTDHGDGSYNGFFAGYFNTTSAINALQFKFNSGNIDAGTIKMYGISS